MIFPNADITLTHLMLQPILDPFLIMRSVLGVEGEDQERVEDGCLACPSLFDLAQALFGSISA